MKGSMKVAVMNGVGKMGYTTRPIPTPKDDEVLVKVLEIDDKGRLNLSRRYQAPHPHPQGK